MALCNGQTERTRMLNARHSFALLWQRLVAALSLVMAAALAPAAVSAPAGAGAIGSRIGSGAAVASAANAVAGTVAALVEGGQHQLPLDTPPDGTKAKALTVPVWLALAPLHAAAAALPPAVREAPPTHAARSGPSRAPPVG
jgi:hypothetical protein